MAIITAQAELPKSAPIDGVRQPDTNVEAVQAEAVEAPKVPEDAMGKKFAALARQQKQIREYERQVKAREEALKAKEAQYNTDYIPKSRLKEDPLSVFNDAGLTYNEISEKYLASGSPEEHAMQRLIQEQAKIKADTESLRKQYEEQQSASYQQALKQINNEAKMLVDSDPEFEIIKETGNTEQVASFIEEVFKAEGIVLSVEEAAREVATHLIEESRKFASLNSVKRLLTPEPTAPVQKQEVPNEKQPQQLKTLTNAVTASASKGLSEKERKARAILAFQGRLNT